MIIRRLRVDLTEPLPLAILADPVDGAIILSLFCDARDDAANPSEPRGWWGDALSDGDRWGSRLWILANRAKHTNTTLSEAEQLASEALQWMVKDGDAGAIRVAASAPDAETLLLSISIDGQRIDLEIRS